MASRGNAQDRKDELIYSYRLVDGLTEDQIFRRISIGKKNRHGPGSFVSLFDQQYDDGFLATLDEVVKWVGQRVSKHIHDLVMAQSAKNCSAILGITLIPCGVLSLVPLDAAPWTPSLSQTHNLSDDFIIRYAPSAVIAASSVRKAKSFPDIPSTSHNFVAVGNPLDDLPSARDEVEEISAHFPNNLSCAFGGDATSSFLQAYAADATYLHIASHAEAPITSYSFYKTYSIRYLASHHCPSNLTTCALHCPCIFSKLYTSILPLRLSSSEPSRNSYHQKLKLVHPNFLLMSAVEKSSLGLASNLNLRRSYLRRFFATVRAHASTVFASITAFHQGLKRSASMVCEQSAYSATSTEVSQICCAIHLSFAIPH